MLFAKKSTEFIFNSKIHIRYKLFNGRWLSKMLMLVLAPKVNLDASLPLLMNE